MVINDHNVLHARYAMAQQELEAFKGHISELDEVIEKGLREQIVEMIVEKGLITARKNFITQYVEYAMDCAVLTPKRYKQLLRAERALAHIRKNLQND